MSPDTPALPYPSSSSSTKPPKTEALLKLKEYDREEPKGKDKGNDQELKKLQEQTRKMQELEEKFQQLEREQR